MRLPFTDSDTDTFLPPPLPVTAGSPHAMVTWDLERTSTITGM